MADIPVSIQTFFNQYGVSVSFEPGQTVLHAHTKTKNIYLIRSGLIKAYSVDKAGDMHVHAIFGRSKCLPLMRAVNDVTNNLLCEAILPTTTLRVPREKFLDALKTDPELSFAVLQQSLSQFAMFTNRIENLEYSSARERLLYRLLTLGGQLGEPHGDNCVLRVPFSHEDLAQSIQVSREVVSRQLSALRHKNVIDYQRKLIRFNPGVVLAELWDSNLTLDQFGL